MILCGAELIHCWDTIEMQTDRRLQRLAGIQWNCGTTISRNYVSTSSPLPRRLLRVYFLRFARFLRLMVLDRIVDVAQYISNAVLLVDV
jgi:hypothetical protein